MNLFLILFQKNKINRKNFGSNKFVEANQFISELQKMFEIEEELKEWLKYYLDTTKDGLISFYDLSKCLIFFGDFRNFFYNIKKMKNSNFFIAHVSSMHAKILLEGKTKFSYLFRFSKTECSCFALSIVDKSQKVIHTLFDSSLFFNKQSQFFNKSLSFPNPNHLQTNVNHDIKTKPGRRSSEKCVFNNISHFYKSYKQILLHFVLIDETSYPFLKDFKNMN